MFSTPPNTGWSERGYSIVELICQKRGNQLAISLMQTLYFLAVLKLKVKESFAYEEECMNLENQQNQQENQPENCQNYLQCYKKVFMVIVLSTHYVLLLFIDRLCN